MVKVVFSSAIRSSTNGEAERQVPVKGTVSEILKELVRVYGEKFGQCILDGGKPPQ